jgi:hypothetical protein
MNESNNLYKQIEGLNVKIKKLETIINKTKLDNNFKQNIKKNNKNTILNKNFDNELKTKTKIETYRILHPDPKDNQIGIRKKYIGLIFEHNTNSFDSEDNTGITSNKISPFIKLNGDNIIISYFVQFELNFTPLESTICSIALGIKTKTDSKIKIIKGTKQYFDLSGPNVINSKLTISNTLIYSSEINEELCMIIDFSSGCVVNNKKSIMRILNL